MILLDTHVVMWLHGNQRDRFSRRTHAFLDREQLGLSPFVQLELDLLHEIGRARQPAQVVIDDLTTRLGLIVADAPISAVCRAATELTWARDPFDRLICAHAVASVLPLVTKDESIRRNLSLAWWVE
ncbi:MAG: PIN domain-containing protein [Chloroflexota bacterium]|nr:MAG: PIN domain-containing protein [Chloroflexota bacterium]